MLVVHRRGYGTRVSPTRYLSPNTGAPGRGRKLFTLKKGGLSRYGYQNVLSSSPQKRRNALKRALNSGVSKLTVLTKRTIPALSTAVRRDREWLRSARTSKK